MPDFPRIIDKGAASRFLVPRQAFTARETFEREYRAIFDKCWLYLGHASELAEPGTFLTRKVAQRPILFTRDKEGTYHALFNACPHRGALVCRERKASTSFIQRHLQIGYNRAARIMERMEKEGVVGAANQVGKREVLARNIEAAE